jgi:hypothetical protein
MCMTCDTRTPHESDELGGELASKQVQLWKMANGWRDLQSVQGRRRGSVPICADCIKEIVALTKLPPTYEEQS